MTWLDVEASNGRPVTADLSRCCAQNDCCYAAIAQKAQKSEILGASYNSVLKSWRKKDLRRVDSASGHGWREGPLCQALRWTWRNCIPWKDNGERRDVDFFLEAWIETQKCLLKRTEHLKLYDSSAILQDNAWPHRKWTAVGSMTQTVPYEGHDERRSWTK